MFGDQDFVQRVVLFFIPVVISLSLHEWGHAASAVALGDPTPREQGRLTVNPVVHMDLFGTLILPLVLMFLSLPPFGWAKPVQITPYRFTRRMKMSTGLMLTAAAGPAMNLLLAVVSAVVLAVFFPVVGPATAAQKLLGTMVGLNLVLFFFNLLPFPPLDGSRVLAGLLPRSLRSGYARLERFAPLFLGLLFFTGLGSALISRPTALLSEWLMTLARGLSV